MRNVTKRGPSPISDSTQAAPPYRSANAAMLRSLVDLTPNSATHRLEQFKHWSPEQLRDLLEQQARLRGSVFGSNHNSNVLHLREILQSKLRSHVFHNMPIRVIKLPGMELMERNEVALYLIKTYVEKGADMAIHRITVADSTAQAHYAGKEMQGRAISEWLQGVTRFATLSHTWGQEEPSYKSFNEQRDMQGKKTSEYEKLQRFCDIAHNKYGVEFAWADTVCIDKSSSMELDESIRSMFAWYRDSDICIAYLGETNDLLDCPSDRWFTRGWTLQEILAPHRLKFYNKDWLPLTNFLNDKINHSDEEWLKRLGNSSDPNSNYSYQFHLLHHVILMATGLDMATICHFRPGVHTPSLPERMKWVARRLTTRAEDKAYCMMGVFGVSISVAYGEGAERAFFRLFAAILEVGCHRDWFVWGGKAIPREVHPSRMIPSSPECYLPRDDVGENDLLSMNTRDGELVTLTNLGVPMKMLVVPARVSYSETPSDFYSLSDIHISCPLSDEHVVVQGTASEWEGETEELRAQFSLGVLNIVSPETNPIPKRLYAILLRRRVQELLLTGQSTYPGYPKWEKWETNQALVFQCNERFRRMDVNDWSVIGITRSQVGWSERGDDPKIEFQTLYL
ncbi:heterokaryon incompatibility protein-domain-containing protein [Boletus edulis BED1]|uniref:Heterokaryon incompatibility protein-domain-containing protein n=1 Tax=Boletus edulis BED1 TaxID=1328754 RepID=A0AAD4BNN8_BOLED|nr:heterokaryon incompatibility protein-domain-containing protein [Boletus edulis BED1]